MEFIEKIRIFIERIETKDFYKYTGIFLGISIILAGLIVFRFYRQINYLTKRIDDINEAREEQVRIIRQDALQVQQQQAEVDAILAEEEDFKIGGYFKNLLTKLNLTEKQVAEETATIEREDDYRESELNAKFEDMNMKQLTELLQEIEQNKRISTKKLDITKSTKKPDTIEVTITIGTLLPKTEIAE